jgi:hypothetical protein
MLASALLLTLCWLNKVTNTQNWPTTKGEIAATRVVRNDFTFPGGGIVKAFKGEYELLYSVSGREYSIWVPSGWEDKDPDFIRAKLESHPGTCYNVRYDPSNPVRALGFRIDCGTQMHPESNP